MIWLMFIAGGSYLFIIFKFWIAWEYLPGFEPQVITNYIPVTIIVPVRNEAKNIKNLLQCFNIQNYPTSYLQIIMIDDHSTDETSALITQFKKQNVTLMQLPDMRHGKKAALQTGIEASEGELILLTDADCLMAPAWVSCYVSYYQQYHPVLMLGPVCAIPGKTPFSQMQALEMYGLLGSTAGSAALHRPIMCNGANVAFTRAVYPEIKHIYNNAQVNSGDDIFVLEALKRKHRQAIHFIKAHDIIVTTSIAENLGIFFKQRKRWAAKAVFYDDFEILITAFIVLSLNALLCFTFLVGLFTFEFQNFLCLIIIKSLADWIILSRVTAFYGEKKLMRWFPIVQSLYFAYVFYTVVMALFSSGSWKNRSIKY